MKNFFISSTFTDMQEERDFLRSEVFPRLSQEAFQHSEDVGMRDLRWGIHTSDLGKKEADEHVLSVCLKEIDLCRPYMVVLIGERYGSRFHKEQLEDVLRKLHPASVIEDAIPPLPDDIEELSITEMEIRYGAIWHPKGTPKPKVIFYIKRLEGDGVPPEYTETGEEEKNSLRKLKKLIRNLNDDTGSQSDIVVLENTARWNKSSMSFCYEQDFVSQMTNAILKILQEEWKNAPHLTEYQRELKQHRSYAQANAENFFVRANILNTIYERLSNCRTDFIAIQGEPGSGKTSVMSYLASHPVDTSRTLQDTPDIAVLPLFCGYTPMTSQAGGLMKHMIAFIEEQTNHILSETTSSKSHRHTEFLSKDNRLEGIAPTDNDFEESGFKELLTRLEKSILTFDQHAKDTGKRIFILIDSIDQLDMSKIRDNLLFLPRDLPETVRIVISCVDQFDLSFWKDNVITMNNLEDDKEILGILCNMLSSFGKESEKSLTDTICQKPHSHNPLYLNLLIQRLNMMVKKDYDTIRRMAGEGPYDHNTAGALYKSRLIEACPDELDAMCLHILNTASDQIGGETAQLIVQYISASRSGLRPSDLELIFKKQKKEWNALSFAQFYQYMRALFIIREDDRCDFSHLSIRDGFRKMSELSSGVLDPSTQKPLTHLHRAILAHLESLPGSDPLKMNELVYHCLMADDKNTLLLYLCEICSDSDMDKTDESLNSKILRAAARSIYEICTSTTKTNSIEDSAETAVINHTDWFCQTLDKCEPYEEPEKTALILRFVYRYLTKTFYDSFHELAAQEKIYTKCLKLAEALHHEIHNQESLRILADACYHLGNIYHRQGGILNYSRALGLYLREAKMADRIRHPLDSDIHYLLRKSESLSHLGDIYTDIGGHEYQNRALRAYLKSSNLLDRFLDQTGQHPQETEDSIHRLIQRNCQRIASLQVLNGWESCGKALMNYERAQEIISQSPLSYRYEQISLHLYNGDLVLHTQYMADSSHNPIHDYENAEKLARKLRRDLPKSDHELICLICRERMIYAMTLHKKNENPENIKEKYQPVFDGLNSLLPPHMRGMQVFTDEPPASHIIRLKIMLAVFYEHMARLCLKVHASDEDITHADRLLEEAGTFLEQLCRLDSRASYRHHLLSVYYRRAVILEERKRREAVNNRNLADTDLLVYYRAAKKEAELLLKETRTFQSRHDYLTILAKIGSLYSESAEPGYMQKAEEYYMLSLEEAISLDKELKSPISIMDLTFLCGRISHVCKDRHIAESMEKRSQTLLSKARQLYEIQNFQEYCMDLECTQITLPADR